ncbi:MAG: MAPEG family protein [Rhizobiaceae bacterium]|nr:MAPEG family protein [Rhizobiaceae bacterium]
MTGNIAIFWPMIVQAFLTLGIYGLVFNRRKAAVKAGEANFGTFRVPTNEPAKSAAAVRNLSNQYELPVLFYVVCLSLYVTNGADWLAVVLAWIFVVLRLVHAYVHLGSNDLRLRIPVFFGGVIAVFLLWVILAIHIAKGSILSAVGGPF